MVWRRHYLNEVYVARRLQFLSSLESFRLYPVSARAFKDRVPMVQLLRFLGPQSEEKYHRALPEKVCFEKMCWE
jgi:hypothetical protein